MTIALFDNLTRHYEIVKTENEC
ncbi:hypothetical protein [Agrobacterium larrymoorei]